MDIIAIDNHQLLPGKYIYKVYHGNPEECLKEFKKKFPYYSPEHAFYVTSLNQLWVPMTWARPEFVLGDIDPKSM